MKYYINLKQSMFFTINLCTDIICFIVLLSFHRNFIPFLSNTENKYRTGENNTENLITRENNQWNTMKTKTFFYK